MWTCDSILCVLTLATIFSSKMATGSEGTSHFKQGCPIGERFGSNCYRISTEEVNGYGQIDNCKRVAIRDDEENEFVKGLIRDAGEDFVWIGRDHESSYDNFEYDSSGDCFFMDKYGEWTATTWYRATRRVVCASKLDCLESWIGENCDRQCHCYKVNCTRDQRYCRYGCERGWTGSNCEEEVTAPIVEHHCVKNKTHYSLVLSLDKASETGTVISIDLHSKPITAENYTSGFDEYGVLELSTTDLFLPFEPSLNEKKIDETTFAWFFRFRLHDGLRMQSDVDFRVQCDFADVDVMHSSTSLEFDVASFGKSASISPTPMEVNVNINLKDPKDDNPLTEVALGEPVKFVMSQQYGNGQDGSDKLGTLHMSPRACYARSPDNTMVKQLTDEWGCRLDKAYFRWADLDDNRDQFSKPFPAFGVPGYSSINISCSLVPCFYSDYSCEHPCQYRGYY